MISTQYRIYPKKLEEEKLEFSLDMCRIAYNYLLERLNNNVRGRTALAHSLLALKRKDKRFEDVYSKAVQPQCDKLCFNLRALSQLKKKGHKVGRLRFKGKGWFNTFSYNQSGFKIFDVHGKKGILHLSKIGDMQIKLHREVQGNIKQITLKKSCGKWYAIVVSDANPQRKHGKKHIGIDLGLTNYIMRSDGKRISHPKIFEKYRVKLKKAQQNLSRKKKGSSNRMKARLQVKKIHTKILNARNDFLHKLSAQLVSECKIITFENLNIKGLIQIQRNALNICDASWGKLVQMTSYKAENAGCEVRTINPRHTSMTCHVCGNIQKMPLTQRRYNCVKCGLRMDRDLNSAKQIKLKGKELAYVEGMSDNSNGTAILCET